MLGGGRGGGLGEEKVVNPERTKPPGDEGTSCVNMSVLAITDMPSKTTLQSP